MIDVLDFSPKFTQYWMGVPCQHNSNYDHLQLLPKHDSGGREMLLPAEMPPEKFFDITMPFVTQLQNEAQKRSALGSGLHPYGVLAQGVQVVWIFAAREIDILKDRLSAAEKRIAELEGKREAVT